MNKIIENNSQSILKGLTDGMTVMFGGFGLCGIPENAINYLAVSGIRELTCISNNAGIDDFGLGRLLKNRQMKKMMASYVGENKEFERQLIAGELMVELVPQGTLAERCRAGGAGIPGFYVATGYGTEIAEGKPTRNFNGKPYIMETALHADYAFVKGWKADKAGNVIYKGTALNFNHVMAMAGKTTVVEVEEIVEKLDPNFIHTPGVFVQKVFVGENYEKKIEKRTVKQKNNVG